MAVGALVGSAGARRPWCGCAQTHGYEAAACGHRVTEHRSLLVGGLAWVVLKPSGWVIYPVIRRDRARTRVGVIGTVWPCTDTSGCGRNQDERSQTRVGVHRHGWVCVVLVGPCTGCGGRSGDPAEGRGWGGGTPGGSLLAPRSSRGCPVPMCSSPPRGPVALISLADPAVPGSPEWSRVHSSLCGDHLCLGGGHPCPGGRSPPRLPGLPYVWVRSPPARPARPRSDQAKSNEIKRNQTNFGPAGTTAPPDTAGPTPCP